MSGILEKVKNELGLVLISGSIGLIPYLGIALILSVFKGGPTYDHWLPLSVGAITSLFVWLNAQLGKRLS